MSALVCSGLDATMTGYFDLGACGRRSAEHLASADLFIRCEGEFTRAEDNLGLSCPTAWSRLDDLIRALGCPLREPVRLSAEERRCMLERLSSGDFCTDEAIRLLSVK